MAAKKVYARKSVVSRELPPVVEYVPFRIFAMPGRHPSVYTHSR